MLPTTNRIPTISSSTQLAVRSLEPIRPPDTGLPPERADHTARGRARGTRAALEAPRPSPHLADVLADHRRSGLAGEGLAGLRQLHDDAVDAPGVRGGGVVLRARARRLVAHRAAGPLREADEEALVGAEPVPRRQVLAPRRLLPRVEIGR